MTFTVECWIMFLLMPALGLFLGATKVTIFLWKDERLDIYEKIEYIIASYFIAGIMIMASIGCYKEIQW